MTSRTRKAIALFLAVFVIGLVALFPARLAARWFVPSIPGLVLGQASGTVWNGELHGIEYRGLDASRLEWSLKPLSLLTLAVAADINAQRADAGPLDASVRVSRSGRTEITGLRGGLRIADLEAAGLVPRNIGRGEIILDLERIEIADGRVLAADGRAGLVNLRSGLLPGVALGSYEGELETVDDQVNVRFFDVDAPLRLQGEAQLQPDGNYTSSGTVTLTDETPEQIRRGVALLGQPDASGRYPFRFEGQL